MHPPLTHAPFSLCLANTNLDEEACLRSAKLRKNFAAPCIVLGAYQQCARRSAFVSGAVFLLSGNPQDRALEATRVRLDAELGQVAVKRVKMTKGNFRQLPAELGPMSVQLIV